MWLAAVVGAAQEIEIHPLVRLGYRVQEKLLVTPLRRGRHNQHGRAAARQLALGDQQGNFALLDAQPYAITVMNISQGAAYSRLRRNVQNYRAERRPAHAPVRNPDTELGRASCRERVCQYL